MVQTVDLQVIPTTFFSNEQNADKSRRRQRRRHSKIGRADEQRGNDATRGKVAGRQDHVAARHDICCNHYPED